MPIQVPSGQLRPGAIDVPQTFQSVGTGDAQRLTAAQLQQAGRALGQTGGQLAKLGTDLYHQANDAMSKQQSVLHARELDELLQDYQSKQGHDAYKGREAFGAAAEKLRQKYTKALENDDQTTLFNRMVDQQMAQANGRANAHNTRETRAWNIQMTQVNLNKFAQDYAAAAAEDDSDSPNLGELEKRRQIYEDSGLSPEEAEAELELEFGRHHRLGTARAAMEAEFMKLQQLAGMDEKTAREAMKASVQKLHGASMTLLTDQDPKKARRYFDKHKDEMSAAQVTTITEKLDKLDDEDDALNIVREAMVSAGPDATPTERYEAALAAAAKETDAGRYKMIVSFANSQNAQLTRLDNGHKNDLILRAEQFFYDPDNADKPYEALDPSLREELEKNGLVDEVMDVVGGRDRRTQAQTFLDLIDNPQQLKGMDEQEFVRKYRRKLSKSDFNGALATYYEMNPDKAPVDAGTSVNSDWDYADDVNLVMREQGFYDDQNKRASTYTQGVFDRVRMAFDRLVRTGALTKEMSPSARQDVLRGVFKAEAYVPGTIWDDDAKPYMLMTDEEQEEAVVTYIGLDGDQHTDRVAAIPATGFRGDVGVRAKLWALMSSRTLEPSAGNMLRFWDGLGRPDTVAKMEANVEALAQERNLDTGKAVYDALQAEVVARAAEEKAARLRAAKGSMGDAVGRLKAGGGF